MPKTKAKKKRGGAKAKRVTAKRTTAKKAAPKKPVKKKTVSKKTVKKKAVKKKTAVRSPKAPVASSGLLGRFAKGVGRAIQGAAKGAVEGAVAAVTPQSAGNPEEGSSPPASTQKQ